MFKFLFLSLIGLVGLVSMAPDIRGDELVEMQQRLTVRTNELVPIEIKPTVEKVTWTVLPPNIDGQPKMTEIFREFDPVSKNIRLRFIAYQEGTYYLSVAAANGTIKQYVTTIVAGNGPAPHNDYESLVAAALQKDTDKNRQQLAASLADVYGFASVLDGADTKTVSDFWKTVESFEAKAGTNTALKNLHAAIDTERLRLFTEAPNTLITPEIKTRLHAFAGQTSAAIKKANGSTPIPPPPPIDPFADALKKAFQEETSATKAADVQALASVYRTGQKLATAERTWGDLFGKMAVEAKTVGVNGKLLNMQRLIALELSGRLPTNPTVPTNIELANTTFDRIARVLESLQ